MKKARLRAFWKVWERFGEDFPGEVCSIFRTISNYIACYII